jgi:hypothetical protein
MALDRNFSSLRNLSFIVFQKKTPDIKHHLAQAHSDPIIPYHTSQQPRQRSCFFATHKFEGPIKRQERGECEWEPIKILLKELGLSPTRNSKCHTLTPVAKTT